MSDTERFAAYLPHIRQRWQAEQKGWKRRRELAWIEARSVAKLLRDRFAAERVIAFGSLVRSGPFDKRSDVDLAVAGIPPRQFFRAYAEAMAVMDQFELDLVDLADCSPSLRELILQEGVVL